MSYETDLHEKDGAWIADAKIAGGVDDANNTHPLNCTTDGTLEVQINGTSTPIDVIVDNVVPVSQSGTWTVNLANEPTIDIGIVDQGDPGTEPWLFVTPSSTTATITAVTITTSSTLLLASNPLRKGFTIQCKTTAFYVALSATATTSIYSSYLLRLNEYNRSDYTGPVSAILDTGSAVVQVTELF